MAGCAIFVKDLLTEKGRGLLGKDCGGVKEEGGGDSGGDGGEG